MVWQQEDIPGDWKNGIIIHLLKREISQNAATGAT